MGINFKIFKKDRKGFTLIELLVVIAIIGVLATLAIVSVNYARARAKTAKAQQEINEIFTAMEMLSIDANLWPGQQPINTVGSGANNEICAVAQGCVYGLSDARAGLTATDGNYPNWSGPYIYSISLDSWNNEYFFDTDYSVDVDGQPCGCGGGGCVNAAVVGSFGPDGIGNNQYNCDDIIKILVK
ncbi:MAG: prepilin-type N-terminal cleavage/methylation domain-containing protein [Planctomycetes bacterium]|jgi:prepilin-type N-terminal cleavage/methylation domain-containing protein|nr:prepilin-type N-terminal cleavage/methylation domain-containing protein [Planctomycetota bacterium]